MTSVSQGKHHLLVTESQAQHEHISSLHRCAARKAELLVVACREDCAISHRMHRTTLSSRRANFSATNFYREMSRKADLSIRGSRYCGRDGLARVIHPKNDKRGNTGHAPSNALENSYPLSWRCRDPDNTSQRHSLLITSAADMQNGICPK
jgi:hypothetical protein